MDIAGPNDPIEGFNAQARALGWPTRCDGTLAFEHPEPEQLIAAWNGKRGGRALPARSDFTARELKQHLPRILLFEREHERGGWGPFRIRLMGTGLVQVWGDLTRKFVHEIFPPALQPRWHAFFETVVASGRPLRFLARSDFQGKDFLVAELTAAPLANEAGEPAMVIVLIHVSAEKPWEKVLAEFGERQRLKDRSAA